MTRKRPLKNALIQVRVTQSERTRWIEDAAREQLTLAELVREAVRLRLMPGMGFRPKEDVVTKE